MNRSTWILNSKFIGAHHQALQQLWVRLRIHQCQVHVWLPQGPVSICEGFLKAPRLVNPHPLGVSFHHVSSSSCSLALPSLGPPSGALLKGHPPLEFVAPGVTPWALYPARKNHHAKLKTSRTNSNSQTNCSLNSLNLGRGHEQSEPGARAWPESHWMTMNDNDWQWLTSAIKIKISLSVQC